MSKANERDYVGLSEEFFEVVFNYRRIEEAVRFLSPDIVVHHEHEDIKGLGNWKRRIYEPIVGAIPDVRAEVEGVVATNDVAVARWSGKGVLTGELFGVSLTGKRMEFSGVSWSRFIDGRVVESWTYWSLGYLLRMLVSEVKALRGILPLCSYCKKVRDDEGYWQQVDAYISKHSEADISHGICPQCLKEHYPDQYAELYGGKTEA